MSKTTASSSNSIVQIEGAKAGDVRNDQRFSANTDWWEGQEREEGRGCCYVWAYPSQFGCLILFDAPFPYLELIISLVMPVNLIIFTQFALQLSQCNVPSSSDAASEQGAGLVTGPSCSCLTSAVQESDDPGGGDDADHRGAVGRHGQLEGPRLETCSTETSHSRPRRPSRCSQDYIS